ncbi:MAG: OadG family protein [Eubacteriales bacterium]
MSNLSWGLTGLLLGLGSVFIVLISLIVFISIMGYIVQKGDKKAKKPTLAKSSPVEAKKSVETDEDEIIAVISAAVACMAQQEGKKFKIRSFKRV